MDKPICPPLHLLSTTIHIYRFKKVQFKLSTTQMYRKCPFLSTKGMLTILTKAILVLLTANLYLFHEVQSEATSFQCALAFVGHASVLAANVKIPSGSIIEFQRNDGVTEGKLDENTEKRLEKVEKQLSTFVQQFSELNSTVSHLVSNLQEKGLVPTLSPTSNPTQTTVAPTPSTSSPTSSPTNASGKFPREYS